MITVVVSCYNEGKLLNRAIDSLKNQSCKNFETIIVKDYCDNKETDIICKNLEDEGFNVIWFQKNVGVSITRNLGIKLAKYDIIYTLDGDDELPEKTIEKVNEAFQRYPDADLIFGNYILHIAENNDQTLINCSIITDQNNELDTQKHFKKNILIGNSPFLKSAWEKVNGYSEKYSFGCQDYEFQIRLLKTGCRFFYINETIYYWHKAQTGLNSSIQNRISFDKACFEHIDYLLPYLTNVNYLLNLCKSNNEKNKFRSIFKRTATKNNKKLMIFCALVCPYFLLVKFVRFL